MEKIYHVCTHGLAKGLWFIDDEDYAAGMNSVPVCAWIANVSIYCFCLMSNHVHFILRGEKDNCVRFIREYKRQRSMQLQSKHSDNNVLAGSDIFIGIIDSVDYLKSAIAYVLRNPMAAGLPVLPGEYRWSSAGVYFSEKSFRNISLKRLGDLSDNKRRKLLKTKLLLDDDYLLDANGIIFPGSYVDYRAVENIFHSPKRFLYHLSSTNDMEMELTTGILTKTSYSDTELLASIENICSERYNGRKFASLKIEDRFLVARELRKKYGCGAKQIARVTFLDLDTLKSML